MSELNLNINNKKLEKLYTLLPVDTVIHCQFEKHETYESAEVYMIIGWLGNGQTLFERGGLQVNDMLDEAIRHFTRESSK